MTTDSSLSPAATRSTTRHSVIIDTRLTRGGEDSEHTMVNLSLGGALITPNIRLSIGTAIELTFRVPTLEDPIEVCGVVRWSNAEVIGIQFDGLRAREVWSLNEYFKQFETSD